MQVTLTLTTGCSGFVGLDHILISKELKARQKLSSGRNAGPSEIAKPAVWPKKFQFNSPSSESHRPVTTLTII